MRILLADDQPRVRLALRVLLERQSGIDDCWREQRSKQTQP